MSGVKSSLRLYKCHFSHSSLRHMFSEGCCSQRTFTPVNVSSRSSSSTLFSLFFFWRMDWMSILHLVSQVVFEVIAYRHTVLCVAERQDQSAWPGGSTMLVSCMGLSLVLPLAWGGEKWCLSPSLFSHISAQWTACVCRQVVISSPKEKAKQEDLKQC